MREELKEWIWIISPIFVGMLIIVSCEDYREKNPSSPMDAFRSMDEGAKHDAVRNYCEWNGTTWTYKEGITAWQRVYCQMGNRQGIPGS